jgi:hypothetical protein
MSATRTPATAKPVKSTKPATVRSQKAREAVVLSEVPEAYRAFKAAEKYWEEVKQDLITVCGSGVFDIDEAVVTVGTQTRVTLNGNKVKALLTPLQVASCSNASTFTAVNVSLK